MEAAIDTEVPTHLRMGDVIAKTARVSLKDALRVIASLDAIALHFGIEPAELLEKMQYEHSKATPEQVAACEQAYYALRTEATARPGPIGRKLKLVSKLR